MTTALLTEAVRRFAVNLDGPEQRYTPQGTALAKRVRGMMWRDPAFAIGVFARMQDTANKRFFAQIGGNG